MLGEEKAAAVATLEAAGLDVAFAEPAYDSDVAAGLVLRADPSGGAQVLQGDTVTLTLSLGKLLVPKVRGLDEDAAQDALLAVQLEFGESRERFNENQPAGTVLASVPEQGTELSSGDTVDLVISKGRRPIDVGSWVGMDVDKVRAKIDTLGLVAKVSTVFDDAPVGQVLSQDPPDGILNKGDVVSLTVSKGPELVAVPDVVRFGVDAAVRALEDAGFTTKIERNDVFYAGLGFAVRTDPEPGTMAPKGSLVIITVV